MTKKLIALFLVFVLLFAVAGCEIKTADESTDNSNTNSDTNTEKSSDKIVSQALSLINKGDIEGAYDLLYNIEERNQEQETLFNKFAFAQTEIKKILNGNVVYTMTLSYNEDGYLLNRNVIDLQYDSTIIETSTYDENNNILTYNSSGTGGPAQILHTYDEKGNLISRTIDDTVTETFTYHSNGQMASYTYENKNANGINFVPASLTATFDDKGNIITTETTYLDGSVVSGGSLNYHQLGARPQINNYTNYLNNSDEEIYITYDGNGNKTFEAYGYTVTCDKYNNAIKYENIAGGTDAFGLTIPERPDEYYSYKLFYYPNGAPQVYNPVSFSARISPRILNQYSNFYYNSYLY